MGSLSVDYSPVAEICTCSGAVVSTDLLDGCTANTAMTDDNNTIDKNTMNSDSKVSRRRLDSLFTCPDVTSLASSNKASLSKLVSISYSMLDCMHDNAVPFILTR